MGEPDPLWRARSRIREAVRELVESVREELYEAERLFEEALEYAREAERLFEERIEVYRRRLIEPLVSTLDLEDYRVFALDMPEARRDTIEVIVLPGLIRVRAKADEEALRRALGDRYAAEVKEITWEYRLSEPVEVSRISYEIRGSRVIIRVPSQRHRSPESEGLA